MKTKQTIRTILTLGALAVLVTPARADLVGTQVSGALWVPVYGNNAFDPGHNGGLTDGLNNLGNPVTISSTALEFGFSDPSNIDTADFSSSQLIVSDSVLQDGNSGGSLNWTMTFTDTAFGNMSLAKDFDSFLNGGITGTLNGDVITLTWAGEEGTVVNQEAVFNLTPVPEPTILTLGCLGGLASLVAFRRRK